MELRMRADNFKPYLDKSINVFNSSPNVKNPFLRNEKIAPKSSELSFEDFRAALERGMQLVNKLHSAESVARKNVSAPSKVHTSECKCRLLPQG